MKILDGKETAAALKENLKAKVAEISEKGGRLSLAIILAGDSKPSHMYASFMQKVASGYNIPAALHELPGDVTEDDLAGKIRELNENPDVTGILMMMPLPKHIDKEKMISLINPDKDVDGLTTINMGRLASGKEGLFPCTPRAVMAILDHYGIDMDGKRAVVLGRSKVVGKPVSMLLEGRNATVTVCHSHTRDTGALTREADILVAAVGRPGTVTADMVKPGAVVIDVGINRVNGKTVGDVDYEAVSEVAGSITPVPGGVGSVTTTMVIDAIIRAFKLQHKE